jgi:anti-anti-sigma factor
MANPDLQHVRLSMVGDVALVEVLTKELVGPALAQEFGFELTRIANQDWAKRLLLDFGKTRFMSSTAFAVLFRVVREFTQAGGQIKFCNMDPDVRIGADIVGLPTVVEIHESQAAALRAFAPK